MKKNNVLTILATVFSSIIVVSAPFAFDCKGLSEYQCKNNDDCYWVKGYKSMSGKIVEGYCRAKPMKRKRISIDEEETDRPKGVFSSVTTKKGASLAKRSTE